MNNFQEKVFRTILLMTGCYNLVSCKIDEKGSHNITNDSLSQELKLPNNLIICQLMNALGSTTNSFDLHEKGKKWKHHVQKRSYYNGYGAPSSYT